MSIDQLDAAGRRHPSAGEAAPGLIDAGEPDPLDADAGAGESPSPASARSFTACQLCKGSGSVVVSDLTAQIREQTGRPLFVMSVCPNCQGAGGMLAGG